VCARTPRSGWLPSIPLVAVELAKPVGLAHDVLGEALGELGLIFKVAGEPEDAAAEAIHSDPPELGQKRC
jgi:hypothetical protein